MILTNGFLDYGTPWSLPDVYLFTGNPVIKNNGAIVMGRGAAKQVRDTYPGIDVKLGKHIATRGTSSGLAFVTVNEDRKQILGWFQVKYHWAASADLDLIQNSVATLVDLANLRQDIQFHMNFPGIGNGQLTEEDVLPLLYHLPFNVRIYK